MQSPASAFGRRRHLEVVVRAVLGVAFVLVGWSALADRWRSGEALVVQGILRALGFGSVERYGHELLAVSRTGHHFSAVVSPWCSTLALVLLFFAGVLVLYNVPMRRRLAGLGYACAIVIVGNFVRIVTTLAVGVNRGPGAIEPFHDGPATWFAVAYVLAALFVFATVLIRAHLRPTR